MRDRYILKTALFLFVVLCFSLPDGMTQNTVLPATFREFKTRLAEISSIPNKDARLHKLDQLWNELKQQKRIPFTNGDSAAFLYRGTNNSVSWHGDFDSWGQDTLQKSKGNQIKGTDLWILESRFPADARIDYKLVVDGKWIMDPNNESVQFSGYGPNSELRMPGYVLPRETIKHEDILHGSFSESVQIKSRSLGYEVRYNVYTPAGYASASGLPVVYVADGQEYSDSRLGRMTIVLDNIIAAHKIPPVIAVFIDPRNVETGENRRGDEFTMNPSFADFIANELVPEIDTTYRTRPHPDARAIMGTSLGGINSAYVGMMHPGVFHNLAIHSPAFGYRPAILEMYRDSARKPLKIFMSTGVIHDTEFSARMMREILNEKDYPLKYVEVNQGHSWGNWKGLIDDALIYFWGNKEAEEK